MPAKREYEFVRTLTGSRHIRVKKTSLEKPPAICAKIPAQSEATLSCEAVQTCCSKQHTSPSRKCRGGSCCSIITCAGAVDSGHSSSSERWSTEITPTHQTPRERSSCRARKSASVEPRSNHRASTQAHAPAPKQCRRSTQSSTLINDASDDLQELAQRLRGFAKAIDIVQSSKGCSSRQEIIDRHEPLLNTLRKDIGQPLEFILQRDVSCESLNERKLWIHVKEMAGELAARLVTQIERLEKNYRRMNRTFTDTEHTVASARSGDHTSSGKPTVAFKRPEMCQTSLPTYFPCRQARLEQVDVDEVRRLIKDMQVRLDHAETYTRGQHISGEAKSCHSYPSSTDQPPGYEDVMRGWM